MPDITDAELIDALEDGLMAYANDVYAHGQWTRQWTCIYDGDRMTQADTFREAAMAALEERKQRASKVVPIRLVPTS